MSSWLNIAFRSPTATPTQVQPPPPPPPPPPAPPPAVGPSMKDEFVASTKTPAGPDLTGAPQFQTLAAPPEGESTPSTGPIAKPASEYNKPGGVEGDAVDVDLAFQQGGPSQAAQTLADLTLKNRDVPGYADSLLKASSKTLQAISDKLGERTNKGDLDDKKKDSSGKYNTTYETLKGLSVVADKAGPEGLKLLGQSLASATPNKGEINQLDDKLNELGDEKMPGLEKLAGTLVTELEATGKNKAAKELRKQYKPLAEVPAAPPPGNRWEPGTPLSEAKNAHTTNTRADFNDAKKGDATWFEGDVRMEFNREGKIEMRHDLGNETGDNLTLTEWLNKGKELGVGLKLDVKDEDVFNNRFLEEVRASGVPDNKLMFNYGFGKAEAEGAKTRAMFPNSTLALNPPGGPMNEQVDKLIGQVTRINDANNLPSTGPNKPPATFVFKYGEHPTDPALINKLKEYGTISIWRGDSFQSLSVEDSTKNLRALGIDGMIDLKESVVSSITNKAKDAVKDTVRGLARPFP
ncbi:hypothetical protein HUA76_37015 [Myxococcus sp. CA056]|uniref:FAM151A/B family protein n=1 Tax=Myxococcus sp. CA056 TaxID=2741740 RepID=UPI00157B7662|nr:DUF2181 domain-containing protein [Myxococcus sp. CA056]NTX16386.1 hypothetical protein [Myxococcus sp. CA056]